MTGSRPSSRRRARTTLLGGTAVGLLAVVATAAPALAAPPGPASPGAGRSVVAGTDTTISASVARAELAATAPVVVTSGLNNPRQLSLLPDSSALLVAEAGAGGSSCTSDPQEGTTCVGATGSISAVLAPRSARGVAPTRVVTGLLSGAGPGGIAAVGADGVSAQKITRIYTAMTYAPPDVLPGGLPGDQSGKLLANPAYRRPAVFADITAYEKAHDPDGQGVDSNPYAALALGNRTLVADAAANDVLSVSPDGIVSLFAVLPNIQTGNCAGQPNDNGTTGCDFVPTSLAQAPDGSILVGGLGGETPGAGRVLVLDSSTGAVRRTYANLTAVVGVAAGADGSIYASQLSKHPINGKVTRIGPDGSRVDAAVPFPGGVAVDRAGAVYVAAFSIAPAGGLGVPGVDTSGQVWRIRYTATGTAPAADQ